MFQVAAHACTWAGGAAETTACVRVATLLQLRGSDGHRCLPVPVGTFETVNSELSMSNEISNEIYGKFGFTFLYTQPAQAEARPGHSHFRGAPGQHMGGLATGGDGHGGARQPAKPRHPTPEAGRWVSVGTRRAARRSGRVASERRECVGWDRDSLGGRSRLPRPRGVPSVGRQRRAAAEPRSDKLQFQVHKSNRPVKR